MKNTIKTAICAGLAGMALLTSCEDFLDQTSPSEMFPETVFNSEAYTQQVLNRVYAGLVLDHTYGCRIPLNFSMNSDIELVDALTAETVTADSERGLCNFNAPNWTRLANNWSEMYEIIENANLVIEGIRSSEISGNTNMQYYLGEALTLRAMVYFDLIRHYGDVPMKMETTQSDGSNLYLGKTDRDIIMDTLLVDLAEAAEILPWVGDDGYTSEHCTKGFAYGLAARIALAEAGYSIRESYKEGYVDLNERSEGQGLSGYDLSDATYPTMRPGDTKRRALYEHALECLDAIISSGKHRLNPSFENEWYLSNQLTLDQTYYENLFEVAHGLNYSGEMGYTAGVRLNGTSSYFGYSNSSGKVKLTAPFFMSYDPEDERRDITCAPYDLRNNTPEQVMQNAPFGIYVAKWDVRKMSEAWRAQNSAVSTKTGYGINWIVMRYSDVLLMYAEVVNELYGPDGSGTCGLSAKEALAQVRERAFSSSSDQSEKVDGYLASLNDKESFFEAIVDERAWELAGEAIRKYDLIRWGLLIPKTVEMLDTYRLAIENDEYPSRLYYKIDSSANAWEQIDYSSVCWYEVPEETTGYEYVSWWGNVKSDGVISATNSTYASLNYISSGLIDYDSFEGLQGLDIPIGRHVWPIQSTTISDSNGTLQNSYGFSF